MVISEEFVPEELLISTMNFQSVDFSLKFLYVSFDLRFS